MTDAAGLSTTSDPIYIQVNNAPVPVAADCSWTITYYDHVGNARIQQGDAPLTPQDSSQMSACTSGALIRLLAGLANNGDCGGMAYGDVFSFQISGNYRVSYNNGTAASIPYDTGRLPCPVAGKVDL